MFTVTNQLFVVNRVEAQAAVAVKRGILPADAVDACDDVLETAGGVYVPGPDLVLFRVQVILAAELARLVIAQFKSRSINAVIGSQRCRQNQAVR